MTEIENNPHQALIEKKVAEIFAKSKVHMKSNPHGRCAVEHTLIQTLQATIDTALEGERERIAEWIEEMNEPSTNMMTVAARNEIVLILRKLKALTPLPDKE